MMTSFRKLSLERLARRFDHWEDCWPLIFWTDLAFFFRNNELHVSKI